MATSISAFLFDPAFINHTQPFSPYLTPGGVGLLNQKGMSYFNTAYDVQDVRAANTRKIAWAASAPGALIVDQTTYTQFVSDINNTTSAVRNSLFAIMDELFFNTPTPATMETFLTTDPTASVAYKPGSAVLGSTTNTGTYYLASNSSTGTIVCAQQAQFSILLPQGSGTEEYDLTVYVDNALWLTNYPNTTILGVAPPTDYTTLLTTALSTTSQNLITTAVATSQLNYSSLNTSLDTLNPSGYMNYRVSLIDTTGTIYSIPFNLVYKGTEPTQLQARQAVLAAVLTSGVGTSAQWQARIPDLFVSTRYYLVPFWDNTYNLPNQMLYKGILNLTTATTKTQAILSNFDKTYIATTIECLESPYNRIVLSVVGDPNNPANTPELDALYRDYQSYSSTDAGFLSMSQTTQSFSTTLSTVLGVASGNVTSTVYYPVVDKQLQYISFVQGTTEFCVITSSNYLSILGVAA